jgi:hypothetical protein
MTVLFISDRSHCSQRSFGMRLRDIRLRLSTERAAEMTQHQEGCTYYDCLLHLMNLSF